MTRAEARNAKCQSGGQPMKHTITFEIKLSADSSALRDVTAGLHALKIAPDCLVWSMVSGFAEARLWLSTEGPPELAQTVADYFRPFPAVTRMVFSPGERSTRFR